MSRRGHRARLATVGLLAALLIAALPQGRPRGDLVGHGGIVRALAVSPDGSTVLTGSFDYAAGLWDLKTQSLLARLTGHDGPVNAVIFLGTGTRAATGGDDGVTLIWDLSTRRVRHRLTGSQAKVVALAGSPAGELIATASWDDSVRIYDVATGGERQRLTLPAAANALAFGDDGQTLFTGDKAGRLRAWSLATGQQIADLGGHDLPITHLVRSPDGRHLVSAGIDGTIRVWQVANGRQTAVLRDEGGPILAISLLADGRHAVSAGRDGEIRLWALASGTLVHRCPTHGQPVWALAHGGSGSLVLAAGRDGTVRVWDMANCTAIGAPGALQAEAQPWLTSSHPGARTYRACAPCHALDINGPQRAGPHFAGLFGRRAGAVTGYAYSPALRNAPVTWDAASLTRLLEQGPERFLPGTRMPLQRVPDAVEREALVDYLRILTSSADATNPGD
ncbi:MAG: hypothetical protein MUE49_10265 [Rhodospirillales bacterium]|nr:hypothetical protein [Rhodospirillales bacterium]